MANLAGNHRLCLFCPGAHLVAQLLAVLLNRHKQAVCQHIDVKSADTVCLGNNLHGLLYTKDLSSVFQQHLTDAGGQLQNAFSLSQNVSPLL